MFESIMANTISLRKTHMGLDVSIDEKLMMCDLGRDERYYNASTDYPCSSWHLCGTYRCDGFIDREIGYYYMGVQDMLINEECEREMALSQPDYHWSEEELYIEREQMINPDFTPLDEVVPLPKWKVTSDKITELLEAA